MPRRKKNVKIEKIVRVKRARRVRRPKIKVRMAQKHIDLFTASLSDPENVTGARWPSPTAIPTGTFQLTYDAILTADANGNLAIVVGAASYSSPNAIGALTVASASTAGGALTWGAGATLFPGGAQAAAIYDSYRVVSGCVKVTYIGNTNTDGGLLTGWWDVVNSNNASASLNTYGTNTVPTIASIFSRAYSESYPLRNGMCVKWRPADYDEATFLAATATSPFATYPVLGLLVSGAAASSPVKLRVVFNYEGIAASDTTNFVNAGFAIPNPASLTNAARWGQSLTDKVMPLFGGVNSLGNMMATQAKEMASENILRNADSSGIFNSVRDYLNGPNYNAHGKAPKYILNPVYNGL